ncbi:hypothetical protein JXA12_00575 [Candidatus Woesearchaeota archaeon]|nr:hypothetical protein [Candidatus Woesearchaeota archaeon]
MTDKYEYHKRNDYPGERVAERKRVADRKEAATKRADARVAEKGRTEGLKADARVAKRGRKDGELMDAEIERSTARAKRVKRGRDATDNILAIIIAGILIILVIGFVGGYMALKNQEEKIDSLNRQLATVGIVDYDNVQLSDEAKQVQLYKDFAVLAYDVKKEVTALEDYELIYSDMYQLCSGFAERENSINHALYRFAEKEIVYYEQIAVLADKPGCEAKIEAMRSAMELSKLADEKLYVQTKNVCDEITNDIITDDAKSKTGWNAAMIDATNKAEAFDDAERSVIECFT